MKVGKNLLYSALYALIMLGLILMRKNFDGKSFLNGWSFIYLFYFFSQPFASFIGRNP